MPRGTKPSFLAKRQEGREKKIKDFCVQFLQSCAVLAVLQTEKVKKDTRPHVEIQIQEMKVSALVDTGAAVSVVSEELFDSMPGREFFREVKLNPGFSVNGVGGKQLEIVGRFIVPFSILGIDARHPFYVIRELNNHGCILGVDLIRALNLCITADSVQLRRALTALDPDHHPIFALADFTVPARSMVRKRLHLPADEGTPKRGDLVCIHPNFHCPHVWAGIQEVGEEGEVWVILGNMFEEDVNVAAGEPLAVVDVVTADEVEELSEDEVAAITRGSIQDTTSEPSEEAAAPLSEEEEKKFLSELNVECDEVNKKREYEQLCVKFHDVFSKSKNDIGHCNVIPHVIKMKDEGADPVHQKQFPIPMAHKEAIHGWVDKLLAQGAIELSKSSYNSAIFGVKKKGGDVRVVQDFRGVNAASVPDRYTIRDPRECVDEIGQEASRVFSAIDLTSGFWQQGLAPDSRPYTAFTVPGKGTRYQWCVNPMGLQGAPASFARLMDFVMRGLAHVITYIDDVLVHTKSDDDQLSALEKVFLRFRKYGLKINTRKSTFGARKLEYLGYNISEVACVKTKAR